MRFIILALFMIVGLGGCKETATPQEDSDIGLYDPVAPEGSAFVRFMNFSDIDAQAQINKKNYGDVNDMDVTDYYVVPKGTLNLKFGEKSTTYEIGENEFATVILGTGLKTLRDVENADRTKATIAFYNLSDKSDLTLKAKGGSVNVLKNVDAFTTMARDMNAVKIDFSIFKDGKELAALNEEVIERGNHYSIIFDGTNAKITMAKTDTRK